MAFKLFSDVRETSTAPGTSDFALNGAYDGSYFAFSARYSDGDTGHYFAKGAAGREFGKFTLNDLGGGSYSLTRSVMKSTNANSAVNFASGTVDIAVTDIGPSDLADDDKIDRLAVGGMPLANLIFNGNFRVNQRAYASGASLSAGAFGHDRWKAGASGGNYSFTQGAYSTQITVAANKSIIQVVEDMHVGGGAYTLSWEGTAVARIGVDSATPSGNFATSPITVSGQSADAVISVEFTGANAAGGSSLGTNTGTIAKVQLQPGRAASVFKPREAALERLLCQRYYYRNQFSAGSRIAGHIYNTNSIQVFFPTFPVSMRAAPTMGEGNLTDLNINAWGGGSAAANSSAFASFSRDGNGYNNYTCAGTPLTTGPGFVYSSAGLYYYEASAEL